MFGVCACLPSHRVYGSRAGLDVPVAGSPLLRHTGQGLSSLCLHGSLCVSSGPCTPSLWWLLCGRRETLDPSSVFSVSIIIIATFPSGYCCDSLNNYSKSLFFFFFLIHRDFIQKDCCRGGRDSADRGRGFCSRENPGPAIREPRTCYS